MSPQDYRSGFKNYIFNFFGLMTDFGGLPRRPGSIAYARTHKLFCLTSSIIKSLAAACCAIFVLLL
jgi:hypothetical protein